MKIERSFFLILSIRQIDGTEDFTVYQRLYFGVGFHRMELILVTKDEKMFGVVLFDYFYDDVEP